MNQLWFYGQIGHKLGPYSAQELRDLAMEGKILVTDTVWKEGIEAGVLSDRVKNLYPLHFVRPLPKVVSVPNKPAEEIVSGPPPAPTPVTVAPAAIVNAEELSKPDAAPASSPPDKQRYVKEPDKKMRAMAIRGAKISGQDGFFVQFRKICTKCGHEDSARTNMRIRSGKTKVAFFCPKCRKPREVEIQGMN